MAVTPNEVTDEKVADGVAWPVEDDAVIAWVSDRQKKADQHLGDWYEQAREDFGFQEGPGQWSEEDRAKMEGERRVPVTFNRVAPIINAVCGQEVSNRQEVRYLPRRVGQVQADPMNDAVRWVRDGCNAEDEDSDAFRDMTICGMGWTCTRMDYEVNPEGEGVVQRRDPLLMRWDPAARSKNLADRKWNQADYWMSKADIQSRWPDADLSALVSLRNPTERANPVDVTEAWKYNNSTAGQEQVNDQWRVVHHVERFTKPIYRALKPDANGDQTLATFEDGEFQKYKALYEASTGKTLQYNKVQSRVYWESWTVGNVVLQAGISKIQKDFQYQAMTCFRERETGYWFGLVRLMVDPQRYANRMASLLMSILATGAKGGLLYETGAFVNPQKAKKDWARWDSAIELNDGALAAGKVKAKDPVQLPQGAADLMQLAITSIRDVTGANVEMLGMRQEDQPGIVEDMRTKAGLTILAGVFDAMRLYRKRQGIVLAEMVTKFLADGRLIRVLGQDGAYAFQQLSANGLATDYDLVVDESSASRDVKERTFRVLGPLIPELQQMGVPIPPSVVDYLPIPDSLAMELKKGLIQKSQRPPQPHPDVVKAQVMAEVQAHVAQVKAQAQAQADQARATADIQIEQAKAQLQAQTERLRDSFQLELEKNRAVMQQHTTILTAIINQIGKVAAAEITAQLQPPKDFTDASSYPQ